MRETVNNEDFQKSIGSKLRTLRRDAGLSQRALAQKLDLSHQQIQKYERGDNALPLQRVKSFADVLGVAPAILAFPEADRAGNESVLALSPDRIEFLKYYDALPSWESRRRFLDLLRSLRAFVK